MDHPHSGLAPSPLGLAPSPLGLEPSPLLPPLVVLLALVACSNGPSNENDAAPAEPHVVDSAGITVVTNPAPDPSAAPFLQVGDRPDLMVGGEEDPLYRVRGALRLDDPRIIVADGGSATLRIYDRGGGLSVMAGGVGEGPGEFRSLGAPLPYRGDSILVHDGQLGRITVFDHRLRTGRTSTAADLAYMDPFCALPDGRILARRWTVYRSSRDGTGTDRREIGFFLLAPGGAVRDTLGFFPGNETFFYRGQGVATPWAIPFGRTLAYDAGEGRVALGSTGAFRIQYQVPGEEGGDGRGRPLPARIVRLERSPVHVEPQWIDSIRAREERLIQRGGALTRVHLEEIREALPRHETLPAFHDLRLDRTGRLWVERARPPGDEQPVHDVFDRKGRYLGHVRTPIGLEPTDIGETWILGVRTDQLGVERVELYPLRPTASP